MPTPHRGDRPTTERAVLAARTGVYSLAEIYAAVEAAGAQHTLRDGGDEIVAGLTDTRWKRRVRGALQTLKREGRARRLGDSVWILEGTPVAPRRALLVSLAGGHRDVELRLARASELLAELGEPADLICCDPPYGLGVGGGHRADVGARVYGRNGELVVPGYVDVPAGAGYREFTAEWMTSAVGALRPGGQLAVVTGPQQAAYVQLAAEDAGLTYVNSLAVGKVFPLRTTRRWAHAHWTVTVMTKGRLDDPRRVFTAPPDMPKARSGRDYPQDLWAVGSVGRGDSRPGALRYANSLPVLLVDRLVGALTRDPADAARPDLVCDPFLGGGTTALVACRRGLRFIGGDLNPAALAFTAARLSAELGAGATAAGPVQLALLPG